MPLLIIFAGVFSVAIGLLCAFLGAYMVNGEAHHNSEEGYPAIAIGSAFVLGGFVLVLRGARKLRR